MNHPVLVAKHPAPCSEVRREREREREGELKRARTSYYSPTTSFLLALTSFLSARTS